MAMALTIFVNVNKIQRNRAKHVAKSNFLVFNVIILLVIIPFLVSLSSSQEILIDNDESNNNNENDFMVDERFSIVLSKFLPNPNEGEKTGGSLTHIGLFGTTVNLLKYSKDATWILIGEPKGNYSREDLNGNDESGVIWKCFLDFEKALIKSGNRKGYCQIIKLEDIIQDPDIKRQAYKDAWLGVSMSIIESKRKEMKPQLITCAHRKAFSVDMPMSGACFILNEDKLNKGNSEVKVVQLKADSVLHPKDFLQGNTSNPIFPFSHAAFGMSLNVNGESIFVGSPGDCVNENRSHFSTIAYFGVESSVSPNVLTSNRTAGLPKDEQPYFYGYAVTSGNYYENHTMHLAGGSPRENMLKGAVRISKINSSNTAGADSIDDISQYEKIEGFHMGSYFGSVLYSYDIDQDGLDELFVGAPFTGQLDHNFIQEVVKSADTDNNINTNTAKDTLEELKLNDGDQGCVYIYKSKGGKLRVVQILTGSNTPFSRFGSAISSIQTRDNAITPPKTYIVIGSPNENGNEGAIYLYDTATLVESRTYSKRIGASQSQLKSRGFGYSFSNQADVDDNGTPDLMVGSPLSQQVTLLRTRHQIQLVNTVRVKLSTHPNFVDPEIFSVGKTTEEFKLQASLGWNIPDDIDGNRENLQFWSLVQVDTGEAEGRYTIQSMSSPSRQREETLIDNQTILFSSSSRDREAQQEMFTVIVREFSITRIKSYTDTEEPQGIRITMKSWYNGTRSLNGSNGVDEYILTLQSQPNLIEDERSGSDIKNTFHPYIPSPFVTPLLKKIVGIKSIECRSRKDNCNPSLTISHVQFTTIDNIPLKEFVIGSADEILLKWTLKNSENEDTAVLPGAFISLQLKSKSKSMDSEYLPLFFLGTNNECDKPNFLTSLSHAWWRCNCSGILPSGKSRNMQIRLNMTGIFAEVTQQKLEIELIPSHKHNDRTTAVVLKAKGEPANLNLVANTQVTISGSRNSKNISMENPAFKYSYTVTVIGLSPVSKISAEFCFPLKSKSDAENIVFVNTPTITPPLQTNNNNMGPICVPSIPFADAFLHATTQPTPTSEGHGVNIKVTIPQIGVPSLPPLPIPSGKNPPQVTDRSHTKPSTSGFIQSDDPDSINKIGKARSLNYNHNNTRVLSCRQPNGDNKSRSDQDQDSDTECIHVKCTIPNIRKGARFQIDFSMYLSNDSLAFLASASENAFLLVGGASAHIFEGDERMNHTDKDSAQVKVQLMQQATTAGAPPVWIYVVAVIGGILFLLVSIFCMHKCGFFKREIKEQMNNMKSEMSVTYTTNADDGEYHRNSQESPEPPSSRNSEIQTPTPASSSQDNLLNHVTTL